MYRSCPRKTLFFCATFLLAHFLWAQGISRRTPVVEVVETVGPAVVNISTEQIVRRQANPMIDPFFEEFFAPYHQPHYKTQSLGSGVLVSPEGFIVTNAHVVRRASKIMVTLQNKETYSGETVAYDETNDLAVLKIAGTTPFPCVRWASSREVLIGETVIALGNPFGLTSSVTVGVISARDRTIDTQGRVIFRDFLQTDAAINPGNSGGPLLNINGELVGLNTAVYAQGQGLGFAIPVDRVRETLARLLEAQNQKRLWLGLHLRESKGEGTQWLLEIETIAPGSPAAKAGLKPGDRLLSIDGQQINGLLEFACAVYGKKVGSTVRLWVVSGNTGREKYLTLAARPWTELEKQLWQRMGVQWEEIATEGLRLTEIRPQGPAERIGLSRGDWLLGLGGYSISSSREVEILLNRFAVGEAIPILISRDGRRLSGTLVLE